VEVTAGGSKPSLPEAKIYKEIREVLKRGLTKFMCITVKK
jgi:hypothetical protein